MDLMPHLRTIAPRLRHGLRPVRLPESRPWETVIEDPKMGPVRLTGLWREVPGSEEAVVLVHGLGGCSESHYLAAGVLAADAAGLSSLRLNLRGADRRGEDFYHAGLSADLHAAVACEELRAFRRLYVLGYSLGGHVALRFGTEPGDGRLAAVAAVCSPLDLALSQREIDSPGLWIYRRYLLGNLLRIYTAVAARRPVPVPVEEAARVRTLRTWDDLVVAPRHGFADAEDYYARVSVAPRLPDLRVPALLVSSDCDPMVPARGVLPALERAAAPLLTVRWISGGGHCAFPRGIDAGVGEGTGLEAQILGWMRGRSPG